MDAFLKRFVSNRWVMGTALALGLAGRGAAQTPGAETPAMPPPAVVVPETVQVPEGMNLMAPPGPTAARPYRPASPVLVPDQVWFSWYGSASRRAMLMPSTFGDITGTRSLGFSPFSVSVTSGGSGGTSAGLSGQLNAFILDTGGIRATYTANGTNTLTPGVVIPTYFGVTLPNQTYNTTVPTLTNLFAPLVENSAVTQAISNGLSQMVKFNSGSQAILANPLANIYNIQLVYDVTGPSSAGTPATTTVLPVYTLFLPNPSGGGVVGRTKVSTDNSPIPRDRLIANYDYLSGAPVVRGGVDINRYSFGFEKTIFDGVASVEVRVPFASTASGGSDGTFTEGTHSELGNVALNFKVLLAGGEIYSLTSGLGVSLPTASDSHIRVGEVDIVSVTNEAIICTPYVALGFTPSDRVFGQAWAGVGCDTSGNTVKFNSGSGLRQVGRLDDPFGLQLDLQLGYWLLHPASRQGSFLRGFAPFAEYHYNRTLTAQDNVQVGSISVADFQGNFAESSVSTGFVAQIQDNVNLSAGFTAPLRTSKNDRFGDYQLGVRLNWFFGATGDSRERAIPYY